MKVWTLMILLLWACACGGSASRSDQTGNNITSEADATSIGSILQLSTRIGSTVSILAANEQVMLVNAGQSTPFSFEEDTDFTLTNGLDFEPLFE